MFIAPMPGCHAVPRAHTHCERMTPLHPTGWTVGDLQYSIRSKRLNAAHAAAAVMENASAIGCHGSPDRQFDTPAMRCRSRNAIPVGATMEERAEHLTYGRALFVGAAIAVCTGLVYAVYNVVSVSLVYPHFLDDMAQARIARQQARLSDASQMSALAESVRATTTLGRVIRGNVIGLSVTGAVVSLLTAAIFRGRGARDGAA